MKIGIVGSGMVGSTAAYAMVMQGIGRKIVLVDKNEKRASAEAADLLLIFFSACIQTGKTKQPGFYVDTKTHAVYRVSGQLLDYKTQRYQVNKEGKPVYT
jgi:malate/lactate dehydrogenase